MNQSDESGACAWISGLACTVSLILNLLLTLPGRLLTLVVPLKWYSDVIEARSEKIMKSFRPALLITIACVTGCSSLPPAQRVTTPEATHSYVLAGRIAPTVILEAGLGDGKESWASVYEQISQFTQLFAYDRAGYGASMSANRVRDGATLVRELRSTLQALQLEPPFVLVGHSIGGTYMELYARNYPDEVAGVVLVDSRHADFTRQCQRAEARNCSPPALLSALLPSAPKRELAAGEKTMDEVMQGGPFPNVPLVVLTSGKQFLVGTKFHDVWLDTQKELAALSSESTHTVCERCGHYIHKDKPELVVAAVKDIVQQVRHNKSLGSR